MSGVGIGTILSIYLSPPDAAFCNRLSLLVKILTLSKPTICPTIDNEIYGDG